MALGGEHAGALKRRHRRSPSGLVQRATEIGLRANRWYPFLARVRDLLLGTLALAVSAPVIVVLGLAARRSTGGSALFRQTRVGKDGRDFKVDKIRTLSVEAPADVQKKGAEHLATPLGRVMRRFKLDELPQFWNVVKGEMSLVGPRPIIPEDYSSRENQLRLAVRPGLTGLWQLSRVRELPFDKNPEYDLFYLANRSMIFDLWLLWRTVLLILTGKETRIRLAAQMWERNTSWRQLVPNRSRSIPERDGPLRSRVYLVAAAVILLAACAPGTALAISARQDLLQAQASLLEARRAALDLDPGAARAQLERAGISFAEADQKLSSWATAGLSIIPGLNNNLQVPQAFAKLGPPLVRAGNSGLDLLEAMPFAGGRPAASFNGGVLDLAPFVTADRPARRLQAELKDAHRVLNATPDRFLLPPVAEARASGISLLGEASRQADVAAGAAFLVPRLFGAAGPRTWVIGAENTAELRGRGGYMGSLGTLSADSGRLHLADFRPTSSLRQLSQDESQGGTIDEEFADNYFALGGSVAWQNLLMSPDFPTGARMLLANLDRLAGVRGDGLIGLDPVALSYLMRATGPVEVPGIPEPLHAGNIVDWSLNRIYFLSGDQQEERKELLSVIASVVWSRLLSDPNLKVPELAGALGQALSERHMVLYSSRPEEQKAIERLGIGGSLDDGKDDYFLVVGQNVAENKMDYYMARDIEYSGLLHNDGSLDVQVTTTVTHTAEEGTVFPPFVGGARTDLPSGHIRHFMTLFVPGRAQLQQVLIDGKPTDQFADELEQGKLRLGTYVQVAPGQSRQVTYGYRIPDAVVDGRYGLVLQNQATVRPDNLSVRIKLPDNATATGLRGFRLSRGALSWEGTLKSDTELAARVRSPLGARLRTQLTDFLRKPVGQAASG